jgi:hypothetical protein
MPRTTIPTVTAAELEALDARIAELKSAGRKAVASRILEHTECGRCDGNGRIRGYGHVHGGICFKCGGRGVRLTKRGAAAMELVTAAHRVPADELEAGDVVLWDSPHAAMGRSYWLTVERTERVSTGARIVDGERIPTFGTRLEGQGGGPLTLGDGTVATVRLPLERRRAVLAAALAYQATLTRSGTPRKRAVR